MKPAPEVWPDPNRWDLHRAVKFVADGAQTPGRLGVCLDVLFNDLELYDDPQQGAGAWKFADELPLIDDLMVRLHNVVGSHAPSRAGQAVLSSEQWIDIKLAASRLLSTLEANGLRATP